MTKKNTSTAVATIQDHKKAGLIAKIAARFSVEPVKLMETLKATVFQKANDAQLMALCIVADQYGLNPFTKEIYAFPDKGGGIVPVVGVDGWNRIINEHQQLDGITFDWEKDEDLWVKIGGSNPCPPWIKCTIRRKDRSYPIEATEYFDECFKETIPWKSHPKRMLRHKALIQCSRIAFGFAGIYDQDEAETIIANGEVIEGSAVVIKDRTPLIAAFWTELEKRGIRNDTPGIQEYIKEASEFGGGKQPDCSIEYLAKWGESFIESAAEVDTFIESFRAKFPQETAVA